MYSLDNIIITQEILHTMNRKKGNVGYMAIKIDLEKTYDRLEWNFVRDTLKLFNIPDYDNELYFILQCDSFVQWRSFGRIPSD